MHGGGIIVSFLVISRRSLQNTIAKKCRYIGGFFSGIGFRFFSNTATAYPQFLFHKMISFSILNYFDNLLKYRSKW